MSELDYLSSIEGNGLALIELGRAQPDLAIPACPGWTMTGLAEHLGGVFAFIDATVRQASDKPGSPGATGKPEPDADVFDWLTERLHSVLGAMRDTPPDTPIWTWAPRQDAGFYRRRLASEVAVHLQDARQATGDSTPVDADLAADAIDEYFEVGLSHSTSAPDRSYPTSSLHLHRTDGEGEWMLSSADGSSVEITHEHGKGDAALRGSASDLLLFVWNRGRENLELFGDADVADAWAAVAP